MSLPTRAKCFELACRDQRGIRSTIPLLFRHFDEIKPARAGWWARLRAWWRAER